MAAAKQDDAEQPVWPTCPAVEAAAAHDAHLSPGGQSDGNQIDLFRYNNFIRRGQPL